VDNYRFISEFIVSHFPDSSLEIEREPKVTYKISLRGESLLVIDSTRVTYFFPNRYPKDGFSWSGVLEGSIETISERVLRDLADAGFLTTDRRGKRIIRRAVKLDKKLVVLNVERLAQSKDISLVS
jgi:transposase